MKSDKHHEVLIAGTAGQGVVIQGVVLAHAAVNNGAWVAQAARYGAAMRGGEATADVVVSDQPIDFPHATEPDYLIILSQDTYDKYAKQAGVQVVVYDTFFVTAQKRDGIRQVGIAATDAALETFGDSQAANLIILSALAEVTGIVSPEDLEAGMDASLSVRFREANIKALAMGKEMARKAGRV